MKPATRTVLMFTHEMAIYAGCQRHCCRFPLGKSEQMDTQDAEVLCPRFRRVRKVFHNDHEDRKSSPLSTPYAVDCADSPEEAVALELMEGT